MVPARSQLPVFLPQAKLPKTGERLDVAIKGDGFFEVQLEDGTPAYTRDGALKLSADGRITTSDGLPLQGGFQPVPPGVTAINIASKGEVTLSGPGVKQNFRVQLVRFANPSGLQNLGRNLYVETGASGAPEQGSPRENGYGELAQGYLALSNVKVVEEMVNLIMAQRAYEVNAKAVQASDEMMQTSNNLRR